MVTERKSSVVSLPFLTATRRAGLPCGVTTAPELSWTSWLTVAEYALPAAGFAGIALSVRTLISVPWGITRLVWANAEIVSRRRNATAFFMASPSEHTVKMYLDAG